MRREVIGQMLDYAANAVAYWPENEMQKQFVATCEILNKNPEEELLARWQNWAGEFITATQWAIDTYFAEVSAKAGSSMVL